MADYIRQLSARDILGASLSIYVRNWRSILGLYLPPMLPILAALAIYEVRQSKELTIFFYLLNFIVSIFIVAALTIAVADHCLQRPISFSRSWGSAFRYGGRRLLGTYLLSILITAVGFVLFIIPGIVVSLMFMFSICVVVLEGASGMKALRRSRELSKGKLLRNLGVMYLVALIAYAIVIPASFIIGFGFGAAATLVEGADSRTMLQGMGFMGWAFHFGLSIIAQMAMPPILISIVLLYYDLRARKEAYDSTALAQELLQ